MSQTTGTLALTVASSAMPLIALSVEPQVIARVGMAMRAMRLRSMTLTAPRVLHLSDGLHMGWTNTAPNTAFVVNGKASGDGANLDRIGVAMRRRMPAVSRRERSVSMIGKRTTPQPTPAPITKSRPSLIDLVPEATFSVHEYIVPQNGGN